MIRRILSVVLIMFFLTAWYASVSEKPVQAQQGVPIRIGEGDVTVSGYAHFRYSYTDDQESKLSKSPPRLSVDEPDTMDLTRARLMLDGHLIPDLDYRFGYDVRVGELRDAFVYTEHLPYYDWKLTLGQFKIPFSEAGMLFETPQQETIRGLLIYEGLFVYEKSLTPSLLAPVFLGPILNDREVGLMIEGEMLEKKGIYAIGIFNGNGINKSDDNDAKDFLLHFHVSPWKEETRTKLKPLEFSASFISGSQKESGIGDVGSDNRDKYAFMMKYEIEKAIVTFEYIKQTLDTDGPGEINSKAWYLLMYRDYELRFLKKNQTIRAVIRYEHYDPNSKKGDDEIDVITAGGNWIINEHTRLMLNYNIFEEDKKTKLDNNEFLLQFELKF